MLEVVQETKLLENNSFNVSTLATIAKVVNNTVADVNQYLNTSIPAEAQAGLLYAAVETVVSSELGVDVALMSSAQSLKSLGINVRLDNMGYFTFQEFESKEELHDYI